MSWIDKLIPWHRHEFETVKAWTGPGEVSILFGDWQQTQLLIKVEECECGERRGIVNDGIMEKEYDPEYILAIYDQGKD